jgi:hypothetical protein
MTYPQANHANFLKRNFTLPQVRSMWAQIDAATALAFHSGATATRLDRRHSDGRLVPMYPAKGQQ